tara:strand:+ start:1593 stop:1994 length:402 start_codon:yes stop_codon:yes gene_type:complete
MAFKLGRARQPYAVNGEIKTKLSFKDESTSTPGTPIVRKTLAEGIMGEANMDGSIYLSNKVQPGSEQETQVLLHEMRHATDMKTGKLAYDDDSIKYNGITYLRETIDGKDMIKVDGKWTEAGGNFPWEKDANI